MNRDKRSISVLLVAAIFASCTHHAKVANDSIAKPSGDSVSIVPASDMATDYNAPWRVKRREADKKAMGKEIKSLRKEIKDTVLHIKLGLYEWEDYDRRPMVTISNEEGFKYIFSFCDDVYGADPSILQSNLNYCATNLGFTAKDKLPQLQRFISEVMSSLVRLKEYHPSDTAYISKIENDLLSKKQPEWREHYCKDSVIIHMNEIKEELTHKKNVRYFSCYGGSDSFWRIQVSPTNKGYKIVASVANKGCYDYREYSQRMLAIPQLDVLDTLVPAGRVDSL